jgi:hypothetical protein
MTWWRRCLVLVPVLSFVSAALLLSCGGGSGGGSSPTPLPISLVSVAICAGVPPTPTPTPVPTTGHTPTPVPTPQCSPVSQASVAIGGQVQFNAQGTFQQGNRTPTFHDVTNNSSTGWSNITGNLAGVPNVNGAYTGFNQGCDCVAVNAGGVQSQSVQVGVATPAAACSTCP